MDRRSWATALFSLPLALSFAVSAWVWSHPFPGTDDRLIEPVLLAVFAIGPLIMLVAHRAGASNAMMVGFLVYLGYSAFWGLSWGGLHVLVGVPPSVIALILHYKSKPGPTRRAPQWSAP